MIYIDSNPWWISPLPRLFTLYQASLNLARPPPWGRSGRSLAPGGSKEFMQNVRIAKIFFKTWNFKENPKNIKYWIFLIFEIFFLFPPPLGPGVVCVRGVLKGFEKKVASDRQGTDTKVWCQMWQRVRRMERKSPSQHFASTCISSTCLPWFPGCPSGAISCCFQQVGPPAPQGVPRGAQHIL